MQVLRSSISKLIVISTLWAGFGLYLAQPASAKSSSDAVANLIDEVAQNVENAAFQKELNDISNSRASEDVLIKKLSDLFAKYNFDQQLPSEYELGSKKLYQLLIIQWNCLKSANGMSRAAMPERLKPVNTFQFDKFGTPAQITAASGSLNSGANIKIAVLFSADFFDHSLTPMAGGIAIGAP